MLWSSASSERALPSDRAGSQAFKPAHLDEPHIVVTVQVVGRHPRGQDVLRSGKKVMINPCAHRKEIGGQEAYVGKLT